MKTLLELITIDMREAFAKAGYDEELAKVTLSNRPDLCEYQCNGAMAGAKKYKKAPFMIAEDVAANLKGSAYFESVDVVKPGFINLKLSPECVASYLNEMAGEEKLGVEDEKAPRTVMIDYGGPNVAKPLHVGHLRSAIIRSESWRRSTPRQAPMRRKMKNTERKRCTRPISCRMVTGDTGRSGTTS